MTSAKRTSASDSSAVDVDMKEYKVNEEDDVYIEGEESEESEGIWVPNQLQDILEPIPEWDEDSFDGREWESDPELRARFNDDETYMSWRAERIKAFQDKGFLPDPWSLINAMQDLDEPGRRNMTSGEYLASLASLCVNKLNEEKGKTVEFVSIVRGNIKWGSRRKLYITFMAREYQNGPLMEYQAKAMDFVEDRPPFPILCRPAPYPTI